MFLLSSSSTSLIFRRCHPTRFFIHFILTPCRVLNSLALLYEHRFPFYIYCAALHIVEGSRHSVNTNTASFGLVLWTEYVSLWWSPWLVGGEAGRHPAVHVSLLFHVERYWFSAFVSLVSCLPREKGLTVCVVGGTDYRPHVIINTQTWLNCRRLLTSGEFWKRFTFIVVSCVFGWSSLF